MTHTKSYAAFVLSGLIVISALVPAWFFAIGAIAKFADPTESLIFFQGSMHMAHPWGLWMIRAIAAVELAVAIWLAFSMGRSILPALAGLALLGLFVTLLLAVTRMCPGTGWSCPCFGELQPPFGGRSVMRPLTMDAWFAGILCMHIVLVFLRRRLRPRTRTAGGDPGLRLA